MWLNEQTVPQSTWSTTRQERERTAHRYTPVWMNLSYTLLRERSQTQKGMYWMSAPHEILTIEREGRSVAARGAAWRLTAKGWDFVG